MKHRNTLGGALALLLPIVAIAQTANDRVSQGSGNWSSITWNGWNGTAWVASAAPAASQLVYIENGNSVVYSTGTSPNFNRIYVGTTIAGGLANGSLEVSGGILTANPNSAGAIVAGFAPNSTGTINVTGGTLRTTATTSGGGLQVGLGANSVGALNISAGAITLTQGIVLSLGNGSNASMNVSGGTVTTSTLFASNLDVGGRLNGQTTNATYEQTGGTVTIGHSSASFRVGYAGGSLTADPATAQTIHATARISGGTFTGNVKVGRQVGTDGAGSGTLTIGPNAIINGSTGNWEIGGTGELVFELGSALTFNAVNLTASTVTNALVFSEAGAKLTIDGSNLAVSASYYDPISLINFASGKGPSATSLANVSVSYIGFAEGLIPELTWTDTSLQLSVAYSAIPEPSTYAALLGVAALGLVVLRRRRSGRLG